jgi:SAM-dependent methyltransferase
MAERVFSPSELLALSGGYWPACALHAGVMLDVFTPLGQGTREGMTTSELAATLDCDPRALGMLLDALAAMGLLVKSGQTFDLGCSARELLVRTSPKYIGYIIRHHHRLMASWSRLPEAVRTGEPIRSGAERSDEDREDFLLGMYNLALAIAPGLAKAIDLSGCERLLDLGGGPGTYAIHFCLANPGLRATVFDLAGTKPFAKATITRLGVQDRVDFLAGDYLKDPVPGGFDVAWLSQILHAEGPEGCATILGKAAGALKPGGLLFVHEFMLNDAMDGPEFPALFSLNMLLGTGAGRSYSEGQLRDMIARAGGRGIERLHFKGPNDSGVLRAVVG